MKHTFTSNHLIQHLYNELDYLNELAMQQALKQDDVLRRKYERFKATKNRLKKVTKEPSAKTLQNILAYSSNSRLEAKAH